VAKTHRPPPSALAIMQVVLKRILAALGLAASLASPAATVQAASGCQFVLGFATLAGMIPQQVGTCGDNESHNPANGDALQHTSTGGLLVWRKSDNWTAFTDGFRTWINGPNGLQERLNSQRFPWEAPPAPAASPAPSAQPSPAPSASGSPQAEMDAISVPSGYPPMSDLSPDQRVACVHMAEDLEKAATQAVHMQGDDSSCPYGEDSNWRGFA
jgi:hypothetical protein